MKTKQPHCKLCPLPGDRCKEWRAINEGDQCIYCGHFQECHKRHKYGAKPQEMDGHRFASTAERNRYVELKLAEQAGAIRNLRLQPRYRLECYNLHGESIQIATYVADFEYRNVSNGASVLVTEDVKGMRTAVYRLKKRWFEEQYGREIVETSARGRGKRK